MKLLIAASGTGGHLFPAIATAEQLPDYEIEWLGVPDRLETRLVPQQYPLHTIAVEGFQQRFGLSTLRIFSRLVGSIFQVRRLLKQGQFQGVLTTGGYIAAPAILAARSLGLPTILHESNAFPGKVTRWLSPWCSVVALGFAAAAPYLKSDRKEFVGTPVRVQFRSALVEERSEAQPALSDLPIPDGVPLIVVVGGSQGAVAVNQLVRQATSAWLAEESWVVHLTGDNDPDVKSFSHPHYIALPFYSDMATLLQRATLVISRAGAGTLTEIAVTQTPSILIPFPFAADDHQSYNAAIFATAGAACVYRQADLTPSNLEVEVLNLLRSPDRLQAMSTAAETLAIADSAERLANLVRATIKQEG